MAEGTSDDESLNTALRLIAAVSVDERPQNILTEFADSREFIIDGDALLAELLGDCNYDNSCGGQYLHLIYLCERFMLNFTEKGGVICVLFCEDLVPVWSHDAGLLLAREALRQHLTHNTALRVLTVPNQWSEPWTAYMDNMCPTFVLTSGAMELDHLSHRGMERDLLIMFKIQRLLYLSQQMNVSSIAGIDYKANALKAFFQPGGTKHKYIVDKYSEELRELWDFGIHRASQARPEVSVTFTLQHQVLQESRALSSVRGISGAVACALHLSKAQEQDNMQLRLTTQHICLVKLFLLHLVLMSRVPLRLRSLEVSGYVWTKIGYCILLRLQYRLARVLPLVTEQYLSEGSDDAKLPDVADVMDGRLLTRLLVLGHTRPQLLDEASLDSGVVTEFQFLWDVVMNSVLAENKQDTVLQIMPKAFPIEGLDQLHDKVLDVSYISPEDSTPAEVDQSAVSSEESATPPTVTKGPGLLPIDCPLVREFVGDIQKTVGVADINDHKVRRSMITDVEFDERYHWHSGKPLTDDYDRTKANFEEKLSEDKWERKRQIRGKQKHSNYMYWYGSTLSGYRDAQLIVTEKKQTKSAAKKAGGAVKAGASGHAKPTMSKAEKIKEGNKASLQEAERKKEERRWAEVSTHFSDDVDVTITAINSFLKGCQVDSVRQTAKLKKLNVLWTMWTKLCSANRDAGSRDLALPVAVMQLIQELYKSTPALTDRQTQTLATFLARLSFSDLATSILPTFKAPADLDDKYSVHQSSARFQLVHMSPYLERDLRTDRDPRVQHFIPDTWQRELLDVIDNNQSALIVAPTSSGKTFVSYYCIEKVLRESNDGVVVYVAPTKALVNQVAATVYSRFNKNLPSGTAMYGVFTRDYRTNTLNSQVLITVPECLEILMLSPRRQKWVSRIKYVIFDEVHCLGAEIGAEVWEHLLMMMRCPFVALSATIENPQFVQKWLQNGADLQYSYDEKRGRLRAGGRQSYIVELVEYNERYADLEKNIYFPSVDGSSRDEFVPFHPLLALTRDKLKEMTSFPGALTLSAKECVQMFDAMKEVWPDRKDLERFELETYFGSDISLKRQRAREFERDLKGELLEWKAEGKLDKIVEVIEYIGAQFQQRHHDIMERYLTNAEDESSSRFILDHIPQLMTMLKKEKKLPAIIFSFSRSLCEASVGSVVRSLREKESQLRKLKDVEHWLKLLDRKNTLLDENKETLQEQDSKKKSNAGVAAAKLQLKEVEDDLADARIRARRAITKFLATEEAVPESSLTVILDQTDSQEPLPGCTYVLHGALSKEELSQVFGRLRNMNDGTFMTGIPRGMLYHHSGINNKGRSSAEVLFRSQHVQSVVATGTLALGVHMPCKSVVFAGDSPYLDSLQYRQMSGRSGRRGFDELGNVYFFGLPLKKVKHLLSSKLSALKGNFPIKPSLVLRLYLFCSKSPDKQTALEMTMSLLENPLMTLDNPMLREQIRHFFLYSTEFLVRQGLLNEHGEPQGLAGLAMHLHYHEPGNFVFVDMLRRGLFHTLCARHTKDDGTFSDDLLLTLVIIVANLFGRIPMSKQIAKKLKKQSKNSKVVLPEMPEEFIKAQLNYNKRVSKTFNSYMNVAAKMVEETFSEETKLPMSDVEFPGSSTLTSDALSATLGHASTPYKVCSSFAALSGNSDANLWQETSNFNNIRYGVYCEEDVMPVLPVRPTDRHGNRLLLNGYALDFYKHGSQEAIINDCGLATGEVFQMLKDFILTIKAIAVSLEQMGPEEDNVVRAFRQLKEAYNENFKRAFTADLLD